MKRVSWTLLPVLVLITSSAAGAAGHGFQLTDPAKNGGIVSAVVDAKEVSMGPKAPIIHKSELVRSADGRVRVFFYDKDMKPLDLSKFNQVAKGIVEFMRDKKWVKTPFTLTQEQGSYVANRVPTSAKKPFNIDVYVKENGRELMSPFDDLE